jgi:hypothetical protein
MISDHLNLARNYMKNLAAFYYKNDLYVRLVPSKRLFNSTMVHEVVNRGDVFAMRVSDQQFTVVPGTGKVDHTIIPVTIPFNLGPVHGPLDFGRL